jgi:hypothetical protein
MEASMRPREFIAPIGGGADAWPLAVQAQQPAIPVIGFLGVAAQDVTTDVAFRQGLAGVSLMGGALGVKRIELLRGFLSHATRFAVLANPKKPISDPDVTDVDPLGNSYGEN